MYQIPWELAIPGHLLILVDQSGSMARNNKYIKAAEALQDALEEKLTSCIKGDEVRNRVFITIIGYGSDSDGTTNRVEILKSNLAEEIFEAEINNTTIIEPRAEGCKPMSIAFRLAKQCIEGFNK